MMLKIGVSLPVRELADDLGAIRAFAEAAEALGFTHLRVPDQVLRPGNKHLHEPLMLLAWVAACTRSIELVPSVIVLPARPTVLVAKQVAELDLLSGGRVRMGVGAGADADEFAFLNQDFSTRGARCSEQMTLLKRLWTEDTVSFQGRWDTVENAGLNPLPVQRPIPMWIGARAEPSPPVIRRIGELADGWFVLCTPEQFPDVSERIGAAATGAGRDPAAIGCEAGVAVVGPREAEWQSRVRGWRAAGLTHLCLRTLGGDLKADQHIDKLRDIVDQIPQE